jgi:hypothetical protein
MKGFSLTFFFLCLLLQACGSEIDCPNEQNGTIIGNISPCRDLIELEDGSTIEAINLEEFIGDSIVAEHCRIGFYVLHTGSQCQRGRVVEVVCFTEL